MSEATANNSAQANSGKALLRANTIPARDGGGIVFPEGIWGRGFYLDEWAFIRYCTAQNERHYTEAEKSALSRRKDLEAVVYWAALVIIGVVLVRFKDATGVSMGVIYAGLAAVFAGAYLYHLRRAIYGKPPRFLDAYPDSKPVPYYQQWRPRILLAATQGLHRWAWSHVLRVSIPLLIVFNASIERGADSVPNSVINIFYGFAILEGLLFLTLFVCYLRIRLRLGRAPTGADIEAIETGES